jgi:hypothetical protein
MERNLQAMSSGVKKFGFFVGVLVGFLVGFFVRRQLQSRLDRVASARAAFWAAAAASRRAAKRSFRAIAPDVSTNNIHIFRYFIYFEQLPLRRFLTVRQNRNKTGGDFFYVIVLSVSQFTSPSVANKNK